MQVEVNASTDDMCAPQATAVRPRSGYTEYLADRAYAYSLPQDMGTTTALAREAVLHFIRATGVTVPLHLKEHDPVLEQRIQDITETWAFRDRVRPHITTGTFAAETCFSHLTDVDARAAIAMFTTLMAVLDEQELYDEYGAQDFALALCGGTVHDDAGVLGQLARILIKMGRHFNAFGTTLIISATLHALGGEMLSNQSQPLFTEPQNLGFVEYHRFMTGFAEAYAAFVWCKTDFPAETVYIQVLP